MADTGIGRNFSPKENTESSPYPPPSKKPGESSKNKRECLLEISEATWYNINKQSNDEIEKTFPFTVVYIRIKYLQIMLIKGQDLTTENCKSLLRETKGLNKWRDILC